ncbi:hypothetical protein TRFO_13858 [Tritrichomonas foetus]|uniref:Protein kinase domain-containing protein n=1 Tax=Tritrichomonas foetus TaxID=1144522 RepID=A0A1J4KWN1_9EUKA|nr:hypothetical protein TRFO_13858 [Tritrichomonas foetus]|eukprot:OHT15697.1 hypothetical protein TRFO_13858 [Tritrichomonas foetus]
MKSQKKKAPISLSSEDETNDSSTSDQTASSFSDRSNHDEILPPKPISENDAANQSPKPTSQPPKTTARSQGKEDPQSKEMPSPSPRDQKPKETPRDEGALDKIFVNVSNGIARNINDSGNEVIQEISEMNKFADGHILAGDTYSVTTKKIENGKSYAVKKISSDFVKITNEEEFNQKVAKIQSIDHPALAKLSKMSHENGELIIEYEIPSDTTLTDRLTETSSKIFNDTQKSKIMLGVAAALHILHANGIRHGDATPDQIFLDKNMEPHLAFSGVTEFLDDFASLANVNFLSPELLDASEDFNDGIDSYSFAIIAHSILNEQLPYPELGPIQVAFKVARGMRPPIPETASLKLKNLLNRCTGDDVSLRPSLSEIVYLMMTDQRYRFNNTDQQEFREYRDRVLEKSKTILKIEQLTRDIESGKMDSAFEYGNMLINGIEVPKNEEEGIRYIKMASDSTYIPAQNQYGEYLEKKGKLPEAVELYKSAAHAFHPLGSYNYGRVLQKGIGIAQDPTKSARYMHKAAEDGIIDAQYRYARVLEKGTGDKEQRLRESYKYLQKAADANDPNSLHSIRKAQYYFGVYNEKKFGCDKQDISKAFAYYQKSVDNGYFKPENRLGAIYEIGFNGQPPDQEKAMQHYKVAADNDEKEGCFNYAHCLYDNGQYPAAADYYQRAADSDKKIRYRSSYNLALMLESGENIPKDIEGAIKYYTIAAEGKIKGAQYNLARLFQGLDGVKPNYKESAKWFKCAADQGHVKACFYTAKSFDSGRGTEKSNENAFKYYQKAANDPKEPHIESCYRCAMMEIKQIGTTEKADIERCLRIADENGHVHAKAMIGALMYEGKHFQKDQEKAINFYLKPIALGNPEHPDYIAAYYYALSIKESSPPEAAGYFRKSADTTGEKDDDLRCYEKEYGNPNKSGYYLAQFEFAQMCHEGKGTSKDDKLAFQYYQKAADQNHRESCFQTANMFLNGVGTSVDKKLAYVYMERAARLKHKEASYHYGKACYYGDKEAEIVVNEKEAAKYLKIAAKADITDGMYLYAMCLDKGFGVDENAKEALKCFDKAADKGHVEASYQSGVFAAHSRGSSSRDYQKAIKRFNFAIDKENHKNSLFQKGLLFEYGRTNEKNIPDYNEAEALYKKAKTDDAQYRLLLFLLDGKGSHTDSPNPMKAIEGINEMRENKKHPGATGKYGEILYYGYYNVKKNRKQGLKIIIEAANLEDPYAMALYGMMLNRGIKPVTQDPFTANIYLRKSADLDEPFAQTLYGNNLETNTGFPQGTPTQYKYAAFYYLRAIEQGNPYAKYYYGSLLLEGAPKGCRMIPETGSFIDQYGNQISDAVPMDPATAKILLKEASDADILQAHTKLGRIYKYENNCEYLTLFQKAAHQGDASAAQELGDVYLTGDSSINPSVLPNMALAAKYYKYSAEAGYFKGQFNYAMLLFRVKSPNYREKRKEAFHYMKLAAEQNDPEALHTLGMWYERGFGVDDEMKNNLHQRYVEAYKCYTEAVRHGLQEARIGLFRLYDTGRGFNGQRGPDNAARHLKAASDHRDGIATVMLADYYFNKRYDGVYNPDQAILILKEPVSQGNLECIARAGAMIARGNGLQADQVKGKEFIMKAVENNCPRGFYELARLYEDGIGVEGMDDRAISDAIWKNYELAAHGRCLDGCY